MPGGRCTKARHHGKSLMITCLGIEEGPRDSCPSALESGPCSDGKHWKKERKTDIIVIAVWTENLPGVYSAARIAARLEYSDTGRDRGRRMRHHRDEYLVEGGIAAVDEYRVLAIFEGGGPPRNVVFKYPSYYISATLPSGFSPGRRTGDALRDIEYEIYGHSGVHDDTKRDRLVRAITGTPEFSLSRTIVPAKCPGQMKHLGPS